MEHQYTRLIVFLTAAASFFILGFFTGGLLSPSVEVRETAKLTVMGYVSGGTLALGALSLTILAYAFSEARSRPTAAQKEPYRRLALMAYLITPLSLTDAVVSILYILTEVQYSFEASLFLLYLTVVQLIVLVTAWVFQEFS